MRRFESFRHSQIIADCQLPIANSLRADEPLDQKPIGNPKSEIGNVVGPELE